jgi:predicted DNA binding protein
MRLVDSSVRVRHHCPYCEFSAAYPDLQMALWCNGETDVLRIVAPEPALLKQAVESAKPFFGMEMLSSDERSSVLMTRGCGCPAGPDSVMDTADRNGCWAVQPTTIAGGWEQHRIFAPDQPSLRAFVAACEAMGDIELLSHRTRTTLDVVDQVGAVSVQLFAGLTDRQVEVLATALDEGLLDVPATGSMARAAKKVGISRSTYGEHLRKAVRQLVGNAYPFIRQSGK